MSDVVVLLNQYMKELASTPEDAMDARDLVWLKECQERKKVQQAAATEILAVCAKYFPKTSTHTANDLDAPEILAKAISYFDIDDVKNAGQLYLEWTVEAFVGKKLSDNFEDMLTIYNTLVAQDCTDVEQNKFDWNDGDNHLFYIPTDDNAKVWCATSQNTRYIFIMTCTDSGTITDIHVRRYWDTLKEPRKDWAKEERDKYKGKNGFKLAVKNSSWLGEYWSDNLLGNDYVQRPDLQWWRDHGFKPQYGDCRDEGYVMSTNISRQFYGNHARVDRALYFMSEIHRAFFAIRSAVDTLDELNPSKEV